MERISQVLSKLLLVFFLIVTSCNECYEGDYVCSDDCSGVAKAEVIQKQIIFTFNENTSPEAREAKLEEINQRGDTVSCMCSKDVILLDNVILNGNESLSDAADNMEDEENGIYAYLNINLKIGDSTPNLGAFTMNTDGNTNPTLTLAVIDGGIDREDLEVGDRFWLNEFERDGNSNADDDGNCLIDDIQGYDFSDPDDSPITQHGTFVSRLGIGSLNNNQVGVMDLRIFNDNGDATLFDAVCAMEYAIAKNANVMINSFGYYTQSENTSKLQLYDSLLLYYYKEKMQDILIVASAGNDAVNTDKCLHFPSGFSDASTFGLNNVISVSAIDDNCSTKLSQYANCGLNTVSIATIGDYLVNGELRKGTSYAAPRVANLALKYLLQNEGISPSGVKECLISTAENKGLPVKSGGIPNPDAFYNCTP